MLVGSQGRLSPQESAAGRKGHCLRGVTPRGGCSAAKGAWAGKPAPLEAAPAPQDTGRLVSSQSTRTCITATMFWLCCRFAAYRCSIFHLPTSECPRGVSRGPGNRFLKTRGRAFIGITVFISGVMMTIQKFGGKAIETSSRRFTGRRSTLPRAGRLPRSIEGLQREAPALREGSLRAPPRPGPRQRRGGDPGSPGPCPPAGERPAPGPPGGAALPSPPALPGCPPGPPRCGPLWQHLPGPHAEWAAQAPSPGILPCGAAALGSARSLRPFRVSESPAGTDGNGG